MNKVKYLSGLSLIILGMLACNKDNDPVIEAGVVINELMAVNSTTVSDQNGEFDDWIELYNNSLADIDLSGYYLSDSKSNVTKWKFPEGTMILNKSYLIVWADGDALQMGLHTNYKLSSLGETVLLLTPELKVVDRVTYGEQPIIIGESIVELSFARIPNGTGAFSWQTPTFNSENITNP